MANAGDKPDPELKPEKLNPNLEEDAEEEDDDIEEENDDLEEDSEAAPPKLRRDRETQSRVEKSKLDNLFRRLQNGSVPLRVHDVIVKGNTKTKEYLIEAELEDIRNATSMQEIIQAASVVNYKLRGLECFDSVNITLDAGPPELPGTANVIIEVVETKNPLSGQIGTYTKGEVYIRISFCFYCLVFRLMMLVFRVLCVSLLSLWQWSRWLA